MAAVTGVWGANVWGVNVWGANVWLSAVVPPTPAPGISSYGSAGGGVGKERKAKWGRLLNESLLEPTPREKKAKAPTKREREQAAEVERLLSSITPLPAGTPAAAPAPVVVPPSAPIVAELLACPAAMARVAVVWPVHGATAQVTRATASPVSVRMSPAVGVHNPSDDEMVHLALLAHHLAQPALPVMD